MEIKTLTEDYDWKEAMSYAKFKAEDVAEILKADQGCHDEADWLLIVRLKDGTFGWLNAGCDYTGWDWRAGGNSYVGSTLKDVLYMGGSADGRQRLGYPKNIEDYKE